MRSVAWAGVGCQAVLVSALVACQAVGPRQPTDLNRRITEARELARREGPRAAVPVLQSILVDARSAADRRSEALALGHLGTAHKNLGEFDRALAFHEQSLALKRQLDDRSEQARTLSNIGLVHWSRGACGEAVARFDEASAIFSELNQTDLLASVLNNRGLCLDSLGRFPESRAAYTKALALHRQHGNEQGEAETLANLGGVHLLLGRFADAEHDYRAALAIDERLDSEQGVAADLVNLGAVSSGRGDLSRALADFERARDVSARAGLRKEEADALRGRSRVLSTLGRFDEARTALDEALTTYQRAGMEAERVDALLGHADLALALGDLASASKAFADAGAAAAAIKYVHGEIGSRLGLGELERRWDRTAEAERLFAEVRARAMKAGHLTAQADAALALARIAIESGRLAAADPHIAEAALAAKEAGALVAQGQVALVRGEAARIRKQHDVAKAAYDEAARIGVSSGDPELTWRAAFGEGRILEATGDSDAAVRKYLEAVRVIEDVRSRIATSRSRAGFFADKSHVYTALVSLLIRLGRVHEAFGVAERLRSVGYQDLLARSLALGAADTGEARELLARIEHLQRAVHQRERDADPGVRAATAGFRDELRQAERQWMAAVDRLARAHPSLAMVQRQPDVEVPQLQRGLPAGTALLQFVVGDTETIAFVLSATRLQAWPAKVARETLAARVELLRGLVAERTGSDWRGPAGRLGADLIAPVEQAGWLQGITRLLIVPHAELNYLPFSILIRTSGDRSRLLVEDYAISLLPASSVLDAGQRSRRATAGLLAMAPQPSRLPHSAREVEALGTIFTPRPRVLVGTDATEHSFKQEAGRHRVVHLATHGFFDRNNPLFSGVELGRDDQDDGRLQVFEILGLDLGAALITLSACQTALGGGEVNDVPMGEEFVGLTRAFLSAGARAVMASLWDISDQATPALMESFYAAARRRGLSDALAEVQRQRAAGQGPTAHPFYWAPFVVVGSANAPLGSVNR